MASITDKLHKSLEELYGRLGDAQIEVLYILVAEKPAVKNYSVNEIWQAINRKLAASSYRPNAKNEKQESIMESLFKPGNSYPDIFSTNPDDIDMDNYL